jgi:cytochrome c553
MTNEKKPMKKLMVLGLGLLVAGTLSLRAADVKENWTKSCAKCHGEDGKGKTKMGEKLGMKDYTDAKVQDGLKDAEMIKAIKDGVKDGDKTKMKGFPDLSDDEIKALVAHIRTFKK